MGSKPVSISKRVIKFLDKNPKFKLGDVQDEYESKDSEAVRSAFRRWHKKRTPPKDSKRSNHISENGQNSDQDTSAGKQRNSPTNLTKIDKHTLEEYLLCLIDFDHPDVRVAREIANFVSPKSGFQPETKVKVEFLGVDLDEQIELAEAYRNDIESQIPE